MQLTRFQMAAVKRTAQNTKSLVNSVSKLETKIHDLAGQIVELKNQIEAWEAPIKAMTGGYSSTQVIAWGGLIPDEDLPEVSENSEASDIVESNDLV